MSRPGYNFTKMPLIAKERQARRRSKIKSNQQAYDAEKEKDRERKKKERSLKMGKMTAREIEEYHLKERISIKNIRAKKKSQPTIPVAAAGTSSAGQSPYASNQAMGKAVRKVKSSLPTSRRKKLCIVRRIAQDIGLAMVQPSSKPPGERALTEETKQQVYEFYLNNEISCEPQG